MTKSTDSGGTHTYTQPEATQAERREVLANARKVRLRPGDREPTTYFHEAQLDDDELGGRYSARGPDPVPQQPASSPWTCDPVGIEPPLGEAVDWLPDMLTRDGDDQRGLTPWRYGPTPTGAHSALPLPHTPSHQPPTPEPDDEPTEET
jgi:hypothetical protein